MMNTIRIIENVELFETQNGSIYAGNKANLVVYDKYFNLIEKHDGHISYMLRYKQNILFRIGDVEITYVLNNQNITELSNTTLMGNFIDDNYLYILCSDDLICKYSENFNLEDRYNIGRFPKLIFQDKFLRTPNKSMLCYSLDSNVQLWQYKFTDLLLGVEIHQAGNIVIFEEKVYFYLYDNKGSNRATVCIDTNTGEVLHTYDNFGGDLYLFGNKIGVANSKTAQVLNLDTNEITEYDFCNILQEDDLKISWNHNIFTEDGLLYFVGGKSIFTTNHLGVIDLNKQELIWHSLIEIHDEDNINNNIQDIKLVDNRLYVHCSDNTLHVFENTNG